MKDSPFALLIDFELHLFLQNAAKYMHTFYALLSFVVIRR